MGIKKSTPKKSGPVVTAGRGGSIGASSPQRKMGDNTASSGQKKKKKSENTNFSTTVLKKVAKIDTLPKDVRSSIPFRGFIRDGIIETAPGTLTKTYKLEDVNFSIAPVEEQTSIFKSYMDLLNSFNENTRWEITIFNHEIDKRTTINNVRIPPQHDGLNKYRQEMNGILLKNLKKGNNSIKQDKYLTVAIDDVNIEHGVGVLRRLDVEISKKLKKICKSETEPLTAQERMKLMYDIYNQDFDYRMATGIYNGEETFDLGVVEKAGLSIKDVIGPPSIDFSKSDYFMLGDTYAQAMYLERTPATMSTMFISDLADIQCNMLISTTSELVNQERAIKLVKNEIAGIEAKVSGVNKSNIQEGYVGTYLPPELERSQKNARDLMNDLTERNQNMFFMTITVVVFARTLEQLEENVKLVKSVSGKHLCPIKTMKFQQEFCFNTALPLCRNDIFTELLQTTESAAVFIPYNAQEINQRNAIFYGLNQTTKSMLLYDRLTGGDNYNGLIFGYSGSGKSFTAKCEMISVLLSHTNAQVFVIDPQGEYSPLTQALHGQEIQLSPGNNVYINPLDLDISEDEENENDPITMKVDFVYSMFDIITKGRGMDPIHSSILDRATRKIYAPYLEYLRSHGLTSDYTKCPTLSDLYQELMLQKMERYESGQLADWLSQYAVGSFDTFAHRTNVNTGARFVVYNTKALGSGMKDLGLHICTNDIWNRMIKNSKKHIYTWFYIDEFHILLESDATTLFLKRIWKMARKWMGVPTGIMQNTEDLLRNADTRAIVNNTSFVIMLKEPLMDRQNLQELFNLSNAQLDYITNSDPGHGLLYNGKITVPFGNRFPKDTELYKILTTAHDVSDAKFS